MPESLDPSAFLSLRDRGVPILDVRSPSEYGQAHIPGAISFPIFDDRERSEIGTLYKQVSQEAALLQGLSIAGPKLRKFVEQATLLAPERVVGVHCWRGGKRSESMAWLLENGGFSVSILEGGYKRMRQHFLRILQRTEWPFRLIGGRTGSRKTQILQLLAQRGEAVLDLEAQAEHRGSAFGHLGLPEQPRQEAFENQLADRLERLATAPRIWAEDESRHIGKLIIPAGIWTAMRSAPVDYLDVDRQDRLDHLVAEYGHQSMAGLRDAFDRIKRRMGPQHHKNALEALERGDVRAAAELALAYYDKTYEHHLAHQTEGPIRTVEIPRGLGVEAVVDHLLSS